MTSAVLMAPQLSCNGDGATAEDVAAGEEGAPPSLESTETSLGREQGARQAGQVVSPDQRGVSSARGTLDIGSLNGVIPTSQCTIHPMIHAVFPFIWPEGHRYVNQAPRAPQLGYRPSSSFTTPGNVGSSLLPTASSAIFGTSVRGTLYSSRFDSSPSSLTSLRWNGAVKLPA